MLEDGILKELGLRPGNVKEEVLGGFVDGKGEVVAFSDGEALGFIRVLGHPIGNEPTFPRSSNWVDDKLNVPIVGFFDKRSFEDRLPRAEFSFDKDRAGVDSINEFKDSAVSDKEARVFFSHSLGRGLGGLGEDPLFKVGPCVSGSLMDGYRSELFKVIFFLTVIGGIAALASCDFEMGTG